MPLVYNFQLATAGTLTTNGSANTETETLFLKPGATAPVYMQLLALAGKGAAATTLSAVELRTGRWGTASTSGTGLAFAPKDSANSVTAVTTGSSRSTAGTTRTNAGPIISCSITGKDSWRDNDPDNMPSVRAANAGSLFVADLATSASMGFSFSGEHREF